MVEIDQDLALGHFGNVVHSLAGIIAHAGILVNKAGQHGRDDGLQVSREFLRWWTELSEEGRGEETADTRRETAVTYRAQGNGGSGQANKAAIARMLVDGISILVTELVEDGLNGSGILGGDELADRAFEAGGSKESVKPERHGAAGGL